tara:strand:- start:1487 stop:1882 length:396 start_codon:yes stop_codon:yes gene_type:complete
VLKKKDIVINESNTFNNFDKIIDKFGFGIPGDETLLKGELRILLVKEIQSITASSCFHCERYDHKNLKYKPNAKIRVGIKFFSKLRLKFRDLNNLKEAFPLPLLPFQNYNLYSQKIILKNNNFYFNRFRLR